MKYEVISPVDHDGKKYKIGSTIDVEGDQAEALLKSGSVKEKTAEAKKDGDKK